MLQIWKLVRYGLFLKQYLIRWRNDFSMSLQLDLSSTRTMDIKPMLDSSMMMEFQWLPIKEQRSFWLSANHSSIYIPGYTCTLVSFIIHPMSLYWTTNISTSRGRSINEMQARESMARQATQISIAQAYTIKRVDRLSAI